jgi:hypothetical protein
MVPLSDDNCLIQNAIGGPSLNIYIYDAYIHTHIHTQKETLQF